MLAQGDLQPNYGPSRPGSQTKSGSRSVKAIYSSRVIALDRPESDKTRPVAMGNFLRKCVNKAKARVFKKRVIEAIGDTDYSLGGDRTAELMHKTVLTDFDSNEDYVLHKYDISNAHNEFSRSAAIAAITDAVQELLPWAAGELCTSTDHAYTGHLDHSAMGGDQGDPMVALIFPLLYSKAIKEALTAAASGNHPARAYSYQDDLDIVHHPNCTAQTSTAFHSACSRIGLSANTSKETTTPGRGVPPSSIPLDNTIDHDPKVLKHGQRALPTIPSQEAQPGSQPPLNAPEVARLLSERVTFLSRLAELKDNGLATQDALHLAKTRTSGDFVFLARTVGIPQADARELDDILRHSIARISGVEEKRPRGPSLPPPRLGRLRVLKHRARSQVSERRVMVRAPTQGHEESSRERQYGSGNRRKQVAH